jgi:SAM-dependent methyltransferase
METQADRTRQVVSEEYARKIREATGAGCCGCAPKVDETALAAYSPDEVAALPDGAVDSSFGCGSPTALAGLAAGETVLDLGSGAGIDLVLAARKVGPSGHVIGVDMTDAMIERARRTIAAAGLANVEVRKGIIEELPVGSGTVDWVISNWVINLSPEKPRVFREIARVLKPGGRMLVSDIVAEGLPAEILRDATAYSACVAGALSEAQYLAGLREAGLLDAQVRDRLVYDAEQLLGLVDDGVAPEARPHARELVQVVAGKVASIRIYARKP